MNQSLTRRLTHVFDENNPKLKLELPLLLVDRIDERVRMHIMRAASGTTSPSLEEDDFNHIQAQMANLDSAQTTLLYDETMEWIQEMAAGVVRKMLGTI